MNHTNIACFGLLMLAIIACTANDRTSQSPYANGPQRGESLIQAIVASDGTTTLTLTTFTQRDSRETGGAEEFQGQLLPPGVSIPTFRITLPAAMPPPLAAPIGRVPEGMVVWWAHSIAPNDTSDPLCKESGSLDTEGNVQCGRRWVEERIDSSTTDSDIEIAIRSMDVTPGGNVDLSVRLSKFALHDGDGNTTHCCGDYVAVVRGNFDGSLKAPLIELVGWSGGGSISCGFEGFDSIPGRADCRANW